MNIRARVMRIERVLLFDCLTFFTNTVLSLPSGSFNEDNGGLKVIYVIFLAAILLVVVGCLKWKNWEICKRFKFNQLENRQLSDQTIQFPESFNPHHSVTFDSLPDIQVLIPGSPIDLLEKYFYPKIYTEKHVTCFDTEKEVEVLMKTLKSKHHIERLNVETAKEVGKGWFGPIMNGCIKNGNKTIKCIISTLNELAAPSQVINYFKETAAFREIKHANVLKMMYANIDTIPFWTILEFCHLGDLKSYLVGHRVAHQSICQKGLLMKFAADMANGLNVLHDHKYVHRDFATRNCMVSSDLTIKVGDYGISHEKFRADYFEWEGFFIPLRWLAPEAYQFDGGIFRLRKTTKVTNVWSFGMAIWELISFGMLPFPDLTNEELLNHPKDGNWKKFFDVNNLHKNSQELAKIMDDCLLNVNKRSTMQAIIKHLSAIKIELTSDHLSTTLMRETLSNSGSPCEFIGAEDAFSPDSIINENFNFDSIALSFELASDDDFDVGFNVRSSSSFDLKREFQVAKHSDGGCIKALSFDEGINSRMDEKLCESVKTYYEDMLKMYHSEKAVSEEMPKNFKLNDHDLDESLDCGSHIMMMMGRNKVEELDAENDCEVASEFCDIEQSKSVFVISPNDIYNNQSNGEGSTWGSILPLVSNSASNGINIDADSNSNNNFNSIRQSIVKDFDVHINLNNDNKVDDHEVTSDEDKQKIGEEIAVEHIDIIEMNEDSGDGMQVETPNGILKSGLKNTEANLLHCDVENVSSGSNHPKDDNVITHDNSGFEDNFAPYSEVKDMEQDPSKS